MLLQIKSLVTQTISELFLLTDGTLAVVVSTEDMLKTHPIRSATGWLLITTIYTLKVAQLSFFTKLVSMNVYVVVTVAYEHNNASKIVVFCRWSDTGLILSLIVPVVVPNIGLVRRLPSMNVSTGVAGAPHLIENITV